MILKYKITIIFVLVIQLLLVFSFYKKNMHEVNYKLAFNEINLLKIKNKKLENTLLVYESRLTINKGNNNGKKNINTVTKDTQLFLSDITDIIDLKIKKLVDEKFSTLKEDFIIRMNSIQSSIPIFQERTNVNNMLVNKDYNIIRDQNFKSVLILSDGIIDRAIYAGGFTQEDADVLNSASKNLSIENKIFIMNKLSTAYNESKFSGDFINFELVNSGSSN